MKGCLALALKRALQSGPKSQRLHQGQNHIKDRLHMLVIIDFDTLPSVSLIAINCFRTDRLLM
jgi:hypothetical protein